MPSIEAIWHSERKRIILSGSGMRLTSVNMASTVITNNAAEIRIATPVIVPVYPTLDKLSTSNRSNVECTLSGNIIASNQENESMNYSATFQATA
jgi:hypothetical protein